MSLTPAHLAMKALEAMGFSSTTNYDENVGWHGSLASSPDYFKCEFCGTENLDCTKIEHSDECPVTIARMAVGYTEARSK